MGNVILKQHIFTDNKFELLFLNLTFIAYNHLMQTYIM